MSGYPKLSFPPNDRKKKTLYAFLSTPVRVNSILPYVTNLTIINGGSTGYQLLIKCVTVSDQPPAIHKPCLVSSFQIYSFSSETQIFAGRPNWIPEWQPGKRIVPPQSMQVVKGD